MLSMSHFHAASHVWYGADVSTDETPQSSPFSAEDLRRMALLRHQVQDLDARISQARQWRPSLSADAFDAAPNAPMAGMTVTRASILSKLAKIRGASAFVIQVRARRWLRARRAVRRALLAQEAADSATLEQLPAKQAAALAERRAAASVRLQRAARRFLAVRTTLRLRAERAAAARDAEVARLFDMHSRRSAMEAKCSAAEMERAAAADGAGAVIRAARGEAPESGNSADMPAAPAPPAPPAPYVPGSWLIFGPPGLSAGPALPPLPMQKRGVLSLVSPVRFSVHEGRAAADAAAFPPLGRSQGQGGGSRYHARLSTVESLGDVDLDDAESATGSRAALATAPGGVDERVIGVGLRYGLDVGAASTTSSRSSADGGAQEQPGAAAAVAEEPAQPPALFPVRLLPGVAPYARDAVLHDPTSVWLNTDEAARGGSDAASQAGGSLLGGPRAGLAGVAAGGVSPSGAPVSAGVTAHLLRQPPPPASFAPYASPAPVPSLAVSLRAPPHGDDGALSSAQLGQLDSFLAAVEQGSGGERTANQSSSQRPHWLNADLSVYSVRGNGGTGGGGDAASSPVASMPLPPPLPLPSSEDDVVALTEPVARYLAAASAKAAATSPNTAWLQRMTALDPLGARAASAALPVPEDEDEAVLVSAAAALVAAAKSRSVVLQ